MEGPIMHLKELRERHIELWDWLAKNPSERKIEFFDMHRHRKRPVNLCYACEAAYLIKRRKRSGPMLGMGWGVGGLPCGCCPCSWSDPILPPQNLGRFADAPCFRGWYGLFMLEHHTFDLSQIAIAAEKVRDAWPENFMGMFLWEKPYWQRQGE
jgi:hypothetical protein